MGAKCLGGIGVDLRIGVLFFKFFTLVIRWLGSLFVCLLCVFGFVPSFRGGSPLFLFFWFSVFWVPFPSAVSSWASGFLPAGRPRGFRVGSFLASGFGVSFVGFSYAFFFSSCLLFCWSCFRCSCFAGFFFVACVSGSAASCVLGWRGSSCSFGLGAVFFFGSCVGCGVFCPPGLPCGVFVSACCLCLGRGASCPCSVWCGVPSWCSWLLVRWQVVLCRCYCLSWLLQPCSLRGVWVVVVCFCSPPCVKVWRSTLLKGACYEKVF